MPNISLSLYYKNSAIFVSDSTSTFRSCFFREARTAPAILPVSGQYFYMVFPAFSVKLTRSYSFCRHVLPPALYLIGGRAKAAEIIFDNSVILPRPINKSIYKLLVMLKASKRRRLSFLRLFFRALNVKIGNVPPAIIQPGALRAAFYSADDTRLSVIRKIVEYYGYRLHIRLVPAVLCGFRDRLRPEDFYHPTERV